MKDPTPEIAHAVYSKATALLAGLAGCYELSPPDEDAPMPYAVIEMASVLRDGAKNVDGSEPLIQARIVTEVLDHATPGAIGNALVQGLVPDTIATTASHKIVQAMLDIIVPPQIQRDKDDTWTESIYRFRYILHEN